MALGMKHGFYSASAGGAAAGAAAYQFLFNPDDQVVSIGGADVTVLGSGFSSELGSGPDGLYNDISYFGRGTRFQVLVDGQIIGAGIGNNTKNFSGLLWNEVDTGNSDSIRSWSFNAMSSNSNWDFQYSVFGTPVDVSANEYYRISYYSWQSNRSYGYVNASTLDDTTQPSGNLKWVSPMGTFSTGAYPVYPSSTSDDRNPAADIIFLPS